MYHSGTATHSFIDRPEDMLEISKLLRDPSCRLLTLVGPGGNGKTCLALETMMRLADAFPDGIFFVPLAPLTHPDQIVTAMTEVTPCHIQQNGRSTKEQFFDYLQDKSDAHMLLVMDNFEHLLDGATLLAEMLDITSGLKILVTSREVLNLQEEWVRQIAGMHYPVQVNGKALEDYGAVQLFLDHARRIRGDFDLNEHRHSVIRICQLVEGMPLAIELVAGWLRTLSLSNIVHEIEHNTDFLASRSRNLPERHRSILSVFRQSWGMLTEDERSVFQKLCIFRGTFTREAAEAVADASLQTLGGLVDKSLLRLSADGLYDIHQLLRQYGMEEAERSNLTVPVQQAYVDYYMGMLQRLEAEIKSHQQIAALKIIEAEFENIRHAWHLAIAMQHIEALGLAAESLHFFGDMRGRYDEIAALLHAAADQESSETTPHQRRFLHRIKARLIRLIVLGNMRIDASIRAQIDTCLATARHWQDEREIGFCLMVSGLVAAWEHPKEGSALSQEATAIFQECRRVYEQLGDDFYIAEILAWLASTDDADSETNEGLMKQALELRQKIGDSNGIAWITLNLTHFTLFNLDYVACQQYAREALALMREIGSMKGILQAMFEVAQMTLLQGHFEETRDLTERIRELAEHSNNIDGKMMAAGLLSFLTAVEHEDYVTALELGQKSYALSQEPYFGGHNNLCTRWGQIIAQCGLGQYDVVRQHYGDLFEKSITEPAAATLCIVLESVICAQEGHTEEATELLGLAFQQPNWISGWLHRWPLLTTLHEHLCQKLGNVHFQLAWERGEERDLIMTARSLPDMNGQTTSQTANETLSEPLSQRELEVLSLLANGLSNREIAEQLFLAVSTIKVHTRNIYGKLQVRNRAEAVAQATRMNLL